jgi:hypothetical protein
MKTTIIISSVSLLVGALLVLTGYFIYTVIRTQQKVEGNSQAISQIINYLNGQIAKTATSTNQ